jgi:uncharacterized protein YjiS (DUF1127 family)
MQAWPRITPAIWRTIVPVLRLWWRRAATRRGSHELQARALQDIGLTERDRSRECGKWFWQE